MLSFAAAAQIIKILAAVSADLAAANEARFIQCQIGIADGTLLFEECNCTDKYSTTDDEGQHSYSPKVEKASPPIRAMRSSSFRYSDVVLSALATK